VKPSIKLTPDPDVLAILREQPNGSRYVTTLVRDAESRWRACLDRLREAGWSSNELLAACDSLNGYHLLPEIRPATWAAIDLQDTRGLAEKWELDAERWAARVQRIHESEVDARCLLEVTAQFWRHDPRVEAAIRAMP
jgi:hypothetical protein